MAFGRKKAEETEAFLNQILNSQDLDVIVVRGKDCRLLYANRSAQARMQKDGIEPAACKRGYNQFFDHLCENCPHNNDQAPSTPYSFEARDSEKHIYSVRANQIEWMDGKPASILFLRDITEQQELEQRLYSLAYMDQLTGVPNRRKFREDFDAIVPDIEAGNRMGLVSIFDLDNFKLINDTYGHNTGDVMLKRLTEHLENDPAFKDHLYRLGGDEFVLFYRDKMGKFASAEAMQEHYAKLLQGAFLSYTMPNIEMACTISMGAAFYPHHGTTTSELLRKSDIALYQAKTSGRNRLVFFEDQYDTAKKFKDLYINIQPILTHLSRTYGYELVDRGDEESGGEDAVNLTDVNRTMDALGLSDMQNDAKYFISYTPQLLAESVSKNLPRNKFVVQVDLGEAKTPQQALARLKELRAAGYTIALTGVDRQNATSDTLALADYVKFKALALDGLSQGRLIEANPSQRFIATQVNTQEDFDAAKRRGYKLFQGFFFGETPPVERRTKDIAPLKANYYRLLKLASTDGYVDFREISAVISSDVALSYKLLRLLNSAALGLRNQVSSIDMAVAYLGEESLKKWIAMLALRGVGSDKPLELVRISLIRAQFGELLAPHFNPRRNPKHVFLVGLFSLLHIALDKTREELLAEIPVAEDIRESLLTKHGVHSDLLAFFTNYEYANWDEVTRFAQEHGLTDELINDAYIEAVKWYNNLTED